MNSKFSKWRHLLLGRWSHLVGRWPKSVLALAMLAAAASIVITAMRLQFQPDRNDLLADSLPWNKTFIDWQHTFPGKDDLIVIVDAGTASAAAGPLVDKIAEALGKAPGIAKVEWKHPRASYSAKTIRLLSWDRFEAQVAQLAEAKTLLQSATPASLIGAITRELRATESKPGETVDPAAQQAAAIGKIRSLAALIAAMTQRLTANDDDEKTLATLVETQPEFAFLSPDDRFYFLRVSPRRDEGSLNEFATAIQSIRSLLASHESEAAAAGMSLGLTGIPVIEMDETEVATMDSTIASIVSVVLILILLMIAFYSVRTPLLAILALLIGIAWSFGYVTLFVGHLQVISVVFTVMLLSLGVAYGIHIAARFELIRHQHARGLGGFLATLRDTIETIGPGVFTGAVTTAAAFAVTIFTDFKGVAEMGHIAGVGIVLCLLAMFSVFPALLRLFRNELKHFKPMENRGFHFFEERWALPFARRPWVTITITLIISVLSVAAIARMHFDFDLLKLFPRGVESVDWQTRLSQAGRPIYFGASVSKDIEEARVSAEKMREKATISPSFGGIGLLFPEHDAKKIERLSALRAQLIGQTTTIDPSTSGPDLLTTFRSLELAMVIAITRPMPEEIRSELTLLSKTTSSAVASLAAMDDVKRQTREARLDTEYRGWRGQSARRILAALDVSPLTLADFPAELLSPYIAPDGRVVLEVYPLLPAGVSSILDPAFLPQYVRDMESVDANITGPSPQIYRSGLLIKESYQMAGIVALLLVFALVWLDFQRLGDALLSLVPVGVGFAVTFAIMWAMDMQINPANIIVLPLMFGIGVDAGVHMIHRYRQSPTTRPLGLSDGTGKGITITNLATVLGFATLMFARHRGVASLGFVLTVGIALTTLACWVVMPAVLEVVQRRAERRAILK